MSSGAEYSFTRCYDKKNSGKDKHSTPVIYEQQTGRSPHLSSLTHVIKVAEFKVRAANSSCSTVTFVL